MARYTLCPFFNHDKRNARITCEDTYRRFDSNEEKWSWMDMYCDNEWMKCPYAIDLSEAYERLEKGDKEALEKHEIEALKKELKSMATKLGTAEKKIERMQKKIDELRAVNQSFTNVNDSLEKQKKELYKRWKDTESQLKEYESKVGGQVQRIAEIYEQRLAYMIEAYTPDRKLYEEEIKEWAGEKAFAIILDKDDFGEYWKVVFETDGNGKTDNVSNEVSETE